MPYKVCYKGYAIHGMLWYAMLYAIWYAMLYMVYYIWYAIIIPFVLLHARYHGIHAHTNSSLYASKRERADPMICLPNALPPSNLLYYRALGAYQFAPVATHGNAESENAIYENAIYAML